VLVAKEVADDDVGVVGGDGLVVLQARVKVVVLVGRDVSGQVRLLSALADGAEGLVEPLELLRARLLAVAARLDLGVELMK
jgi:hypothetical protein